MSANELRRIALSDPLSSTPSRFVVGGQVSQVVSGDVKLYEWKREKGEMDMVGLQTDVGQIKAMAWCPLPTHRNILAAGLSNGKTHLLSLSPSTLSLALSASSSAQTSTSTIATLNVKYSRPVTSISFSPLDPNYVATGYERHRSEYSLLIWDIADALAASQLPPDGDDDNDGHSWERPMAGGEHRLSVTNLTAKVNTNPSDPKHIQHYCPSEHVNSVAFMPRSTHQLLASVSGKTIRLFDLRTPSPSAGGSTTPRDPPASASTAGASHQWFTRAVNGLTPDPVNEHCFASYEITPGGGPVNSVVRLWDSRKSGHELLNFDVPGGIVGMEWMKGRDGLLGIGTKDKGVGLWEIIEGKRVEEEKVVEEWITLGGMRQIVKPKQNLHSFAFAYSDKGEGDVMFVLRDGTIGVGPISSAPIFASGPQGDVAICTPSIRVLDPDLIPDSDQPEQPPSPKSPPPTARSDLLEENDNAYRANRFQLAPERVTQLIAERSRSASPAFGTPVSGMTPFGSVNGLREWYETKEKLVDSNEELIGGWEGWRRANGNDVGVVMRRRALEGYGLDDLLLNAAIATRHPGKERLAGIWEFVDHLTRVMSPALSSHRGYNLTHHGVFPIWFGVTNEHHPSSPSSIYSTATLQDNVHHHQPPARSGSAAWTALKSQSSGSIPHSRQTSSPMPGSSTPTRERKASDRRGEREPEVDRDYAQAIEILNERRREAGGVGRPGVVRAAVGGQRTEMRKLILAVCGENGESAKEETDRLVDSGQRTKAAFRAYFAGDEAATVSILMASEDQNHRLLGSTIAGFMSQSASARGSDFFNSHWHGLVNRVDDPFVRAILSRIGGDDWESVLEEEGIPLLDRVAVGVQHLDDKEFTSFLRGRFFTRLIRSASLHLLALSGLATPGVSLLSRYLARTGDLQSVALLSALFPTAKLDKNERETIERWKEGYRDMLDSWGMWGERCAFDVKWGEIQRGFGAGSSPFSEKDKIGGEKCPVCNNTLTKESESRLHRKHAVRGNVNVGWPSERTTTCMYCSSALPRCVICLMHVDPQRPPPPQGESDRVDHVSDTIDAAYVCCLTCRHGGHASHILPWFEGGLDGGVPHTKCPVAGCECECANV
ncbi:hypothetical protein IAT40_000667 [Kwoniella sp. CBS 6097]